MGQRPKRRKPTKTWKDFETVLSRSFGTERNVLSGMWKGFSGSDTLHPHLYIEAKYRASVKFGVDLSRSVGVVSDESGEIWIFRNDINPTETPHLPLKRRTFAAALLNDTKQKAAGEDKTPIVAIKEKGMKGWYFVIFKHDYQTLKQYYGQK